MELAHPRSVAEVLSLLAEHGEAARLVAGGTAITIMLKNRLIAPSVLVSIGRLDELRYINSEPDGGLRIGALTTIREVELSPLVRKRNPTLAYAFSKVANVRVRNVATVGGNLAEADYASDPPGALTAMRARVRTTSGRGEREIPLRSFFKDFYETCLEPGELLTEIVVPGQPPGARSSYLKHVTRSSEDRPCVTVSVVVQLEPGGICKELRVVVAAVADTPQEFDAVEAVAHGRTLTEDLIAEIADGYASNVSPISDIRGSDWYRKRLTSVLVKRAIHKALADGS